MFDVNLSKEIFSQLINGKVISKSILNNGGDFIDNPLFAEIIHNLDDYRTQYKMSGYDFVEQSDFFYIREQVIQENDLKTDITMKVCVLLLLIGKYLTESNFRLTKLTESSGGLTNADFDAIQERPDTQEILDKSKIKDFRTGIKSILVDKNILLQKPGSHSYILSDAGRFFFTEIVANYNS